MIIGIPKEIKSNEFRVAATPAGVKELTAHKHRVIVEKDAGKGSGITDEEYQEAGAELVLRDYLYNNSEMIYKVKEILPDEYKYLREGLIVLTYIHSNAHREETDAFLSSKAIGIAYEDITDDQGDFPLLRPMSEIAGKGAFLAACHFMQKINGGCGLLLSRVSGIRTPEITIIGAGNAGIGAAEMAAALGNKVTMLDISVPRMEAARKYLPLNVQFLTSNRRNLIESLKRTDVLINCILWPKWRTDHLVTREMMALLKPGAMVVDVACDEAGAIETCRATTHDNPIYFDEGVMHYCVDNIPSAFSQTATHALCNVTLPYALEIADKGCTSALLENHHLRKGLSFYLGELTLEETGKKQNRAYKSPEEVLRMEFRS